jgi:uncharacterized protein YigE (DUF2233 family)
MLAFSNSLSLSRMKKKTQLLFSLTLICLIGCANSGNNNEKKTTTVPTINWKTIDSGLFLAEIDATAKSDYGDSKFTVLKIDPAHYNFTLVSAKQPGEGVATAEAWAKKKNLIATFNTSMYRMDFQTSVGFMKHYDFVNNGELNADNTIAAFNRKDESVPEVQIIDRTCQNWEELKTKYNSFSQSIRMVDCHQNNKWQVDEKRWSMIVMCMTKDGKVLFAFTRSPYTVHNFIKMLLKLPLNIHNMMYLEGGPEASMYVNHKGVEVKKFGSYETGFNENDDNNEFWQIPNMIGISKK